jgi:putative FmdB family regulatory protein
MPTYEYRCDECQKIYDVIQRISDVALTICPACGSQHIKRCISLPAIITKSKTVPQAARTEPPALSLDSMPPNFNHPNLRWRVAL